MGHLGRATCTVHPISAHTSQEGIECTKAKELLWFYFPDIYTYLPNFLPHSFTVQSPPKIIKQPPTDELLFQVKSRADESDKPFIIECEADGEPAPE